MSESHEPRERPDVSRGELAPMESYEHTAAPVVHAGGCTPDGSGARGNAPYLYGL